MKESVASLTPACNKLSDCYQTIKIVLVAKEDKFSKDKLIFRVHSVIRKGKRIKLKILTTFGGLT